MNNIADRIRIALESFPDKAELIDHLNTRTSYNTPRLRCHYYWTEWHTPRRIRKKSTSIAVVHKSSGRLKRCKQWTRATIDSPLRRALIGPLSSQVNHHRQLTYSPHLRCHANRAMRCTSAGPKRVPPVAFVCRLSLCRLKGNLYCAIARW